MQRALAILQRKCCEAPYAKQLGQLVIPIGELDCRILDKLFYHRFNAVGHLWGAKFMFRTKQSVAQHSSGALP
jgi:hypothetical protein